MNVLPFAILGIIAWCAVRLCIHAMRGLGASPWVWGAALLAAVLLLRPHGDTFTALDHSGYRLMAYAFSTGRGPNDVDGLLLELPGEIRQDCTLLPRTVERNTRERSFLLRSDATGVTEPFFYPTLPMAAAALQRIWPWGGMDLLVPLIGLALAWSLLAAGWRRGGGAGLCLTAGLFLATPLPAMLLRGFYAEVGGAALIALAALHWLTSPPDRPVSLAAYAALGMAPALHPVLIVMSLPMLAALMAGAHQSVRRLAAGLASFTLGVVLLAWLTESICAPYGSMGFGNLRYNFRASQSHQVAYLFMLGFGAAFAGIFAWRLRGEATFLRGIQRLRPASGFWLVLSALPLGLALGFWREGPRVARGLSDLWSGVGWPAAVLLTVCALVMLFSPGAARARFVAGVSLAVLPVFAYLKGAEQMGMWSQRRLAPIVLLLLPALLAPAARYLGGIDRKRWFAAVLPGAVALALGGANAWRWPAPYWVRQEAGALEQVEQLKERMGDRLVFFDYLPDSFPFAVDGRTRAAGWSRGARRRNWEILIQWLRERAGVETVWLVTSYSSPGLEDGLRLSLLSTEVIPVARVHSKQALPAVRRDTERRLHLLEVEPAGDQPLSLHKTFDGGPLALRNSWGPVRPMSLPDGTRTQGQWSREGSGVIGPVPKTGRIRMVLTAASSQKEAQRLRIIPPWGEDQAVEVMVDPFTAEYTIWLEAPVSARLERTGVYRFHVADPYNPSRDGLGGYPADLGVLIHAVRLDEME